MAPTTRSSAQAHPSVIPSTESFSGDSDQGNQDEDMVDSQDYIEDDHGNSEEEDIDEVSGQHAVASNTQQLLQPLQDTVQRISRQIEEFAKALDQFGKRLKNEAEASWSGTEQLATRFRDITLARKRDADGRPSNLRSNSRSRASTDGSSESQSIQLEANLWNLAQTLLLCQNPQSTSNAQSNQATRLSELHRYSPPFDIWNAFLDSDQTAQEYECILDWLQERADITRPPVKDIISKITEDTGLGDGIWSAGPFYTKAKIKTQKRQRVWPMPLNPENPGLQTSHIVEESGKPLVTQLDPDARSREAAVLVSEDKSKEDIAWQACWEMLRRGFPLGKSRHWWSERKELWRSIVIRSASIHEAHNVESPWLRIINIASNGDWYNRCKFLSDEVEGMSDFQKAVFGVLCGDVNAPRKVCTTLDDDLFILFNSLLIQRYRHYLQVYTQKLQEPTNIAFEPQQPAFDETQRLLSGARTQANLKSDDYRSLRYLQAALMSHDLDSAFVSLGEAAAQVAHATNLSDHLMKKDDDTPVYEWAQQAARDPDTIRMAAHLQLMFYGLGLLKNAYTNHLYVMENNIASYIGELQRQNKFALIPLYASKLSSERQDVVLGAVFTEVVDSEERETLVRLMKHYSIPVSDIAYAVFYQANNQYVQAFEDASKIIFTPSKVTEYVGPNKVKVVKIRHAYMSEDITLEEAKSILSVQWFRYVDEENWGEKACWPMAQLYKIFLTRGRLAAANSLRAQASLGEISTKAFGMNLVFADAAEDDRMIADEEGDDEGLRPQNRSPNRKRMAQSKSHLLMTSDTSRDALVSKSSTWCQLEQLVTILDALERWNDYAEDVEENRHDAARMRILKRETEDMLRELVECTTPLWDETFLNQPMDEVEERVLTMIRNHYIPECILGYNSALYFAGHALSRTRLLDCMNLAQTIAQSTTLTNAFVESGRMRELVTAFALDSQALLHANEQEANKKSKKSKKENANLDIWQVSWKEERPMVLDTVE